VSGELLLVKLIGAHLFLDYAGQGDFMAKAKNPLTPIPNVPWWLVNSSHAFIHGAAVAWITGVWWLVCLEYVVHATTDEAKCRGHIGFIADQSIHIASKFVWAVIAAAVTA
jgi:hypothetical protein